LALNFGLLLGLAEVVAHRGPITGLLELILYCLLLHQVLPQEILWLLVVVLERTTQVADYLLQGNLVVLEGVLVMVV
jgi:hypothetical protein